MKYHTEITALGVLILALCVFTPNQTIGIAQAILTHTKETLVVVDCFGLRLVCPDNFRFSRPYEPIPRIDVPVFVLHGLGERTWTMSGFVWFLRLAGWARVYTPHWPANTCLLEDCLDALDLEMQRYANKSEPIFVIGNSMGGVMAYHLHTRNWNITASYSVAAPIKGSKLYRKLKQYLPSVVFNYFRQPGQLYLERCEEPPAPPHPWFTIGYYCIFDFDGNVYLSDMPEKNRVSVPGIHYSLAIDPTSWIRLSNAMMSCLPNRFIQ